MKAFNLIRYTLSLVVPAWMFVHSVGAAVASLFLFLYFNNVLDDILFYYGKRKVMHNGKNTIVSSPVNGIITKIENDCQLYSHIHKQDVLTKELYIKYDRPMDKKQKYAHIAIFLNKLSHHVVCNIGSPIESVVQFDMDGNIECMVKDGELIADNKSDYINNPFVDITYRNGVHAIFTLDKYVSKAVVCNKDGIDMFICRGSQCDLYLPHNRFEHHVSLYDKVELFDDIARDTFAEQAYDVSIVHP